MRARLSVLILASLLGLLALSPVSAGSGSRALDVAAGNPLRTLPANRLIRPPLIDNGVPAAIARLRAGEITVSAGKRSETLRGSELVGLLGIDADEPHLRLGAIDPARLEALLSPKILAVLSRPAVGARYLVDPDGAPGIRGVIERVAGSTTDLETAARELRPRIAALLRGGSQGGITLRGRATAHPLSADMLRAIEGNLSLLATEVVRYTPMASNGDGANILVPGRVFAGQTLAPGEWWDFWDRVGPVTEEAGYRWGGAFINGVVEPTGAFAGGICATATGIYAAAARAGLELGTRYPHHSYLPRYPLGLDATVWQEGAAEKTVRFRNDTAHPLTIIFRQRPGFMRVEIWGVDDGRVTQIETGPFLEKRVGPNGLLGGRVTVRRTVTASDGRIIHLDVIRSSYAPF